MRAELPKPGTVYLVGAGPGDPGLITLRGAELLSRAEVVVHDRLVHPRLLSMAPGSAELIDVGKKPGVPFDQAEINALLVSQARLGRCVVRLKGGDPFVLGRGGEEAQALKSAGISFEVVPGITSALAAPAFAGVPVTRRGVSTGFTVLTGRSGEYNTGELDWDAAAKLGGTIVLLMAVANREVIAERLLAAGRDPLTPVIAVEWGTWAAQRSVRTTLGGLAAAELCAPATIVIGDVAALDLSWIERRPLYGWSIAVTRDVAQAGELSNRLAGAGAEPILVPLLSIEPSSGTLRQLRDAAESLGSYDWVVFTSANSVESFLAHVRDARAFSGARIAAVGSATAAALKRHNLVADLVPQSYSAKDLASALVSDGRGKGASRLLFPRSARARENLGNALRQAGWTVDEVEAYRTEPIVPDASGLSELARATAITFCSPSAVASYVELLRTGMLASPGSAPVGYARGDRSEEPRRQILACIGPTTADAAAEEGLVIDVVARSHTVDGLVDALVERATLAPNGTFRAERQ